MSVIDKAVVHCGLLEEHRVVRMPQLARKAVSAFRVEHAASVSVTRWPFTPNVMTGNLASASTRRQVVSVSHAVHERGADLDP